MAIFDSSNPTLKEKTFEQSIAGSYQGEAMTLTGTLNKFGILMALLIASTLFAWDQFCSNERSFTTIHSEPLAKRDSSIWKKNERLLYQ